MDPTDDRPYRITFAPRAEYLRVEVQGPRISLQIVRDYWSDVAEECRRRGVRQALVVENLIGPSPDREEAIPALVEHLRGLGLEGVRIAFVKHDTRDVALAEMAGLLVRATGWDAKTFTDEARALLWLRHGVPETDRAPSLRKDRD
ncbi:MAG TPA: hypothetical protein VFL14_13295 [Xanthomonadales bacterium]|nr:hypothetical protein [Xanthomonadales bacterium]